MRWRACGSRPVVGSSSRIEVGIVHERTGNRQPSLHPAGERIDLRVAALGELDEREQFLGALPCDARRDIEIARIHQQVLAHGELEIRDSRPAGRRRGAP